MRLKQAEQSVLHFGKFRIFGLRSLLLAVNLLCLHQSQNRWWLLFERHKTWTTI